MKRVFKKIIILFFFRIIKINATKSLIQKLCALLGINILELAHNANGILKYQDMSISGEEYFLKDVLFNYFEKNNIQEPILLDVGANIGDYSFELSKIFPNAKIYSFEPNPSSYKILVKNVKGFDNLKCFNIGLGSQSGEMKIFTYKGDTETQHASLFEKVLLDLHKNNDLVSFNVEIDSIDNFCKSTSLGKIDFLKIDTEGYELEVLKGALALIKEKKIEFIQFEFNEMNIISRVFLKDFYDILIGYSFYRLNTNNLIPLYGYNNINEIFRFHNIIAIKDEINIFKYDRK